METPTFLGDRSLQLLLFGGKGGVGKTTCATAAAFTLAGGLPDTSFLLVSIDPAHSLADCLGGILPPENLTTLELNAQECLSRFKAKHHLELHELVSRGTFLDEQDIRQFLELSLPGLDELMAFLEISQWVKGRDYDCIIVDTAPTGHCIHLLTMPKLMHQWLSALDALLAKHRYIKTRFNPSAPDDGVENFLEQLATLVEEIETLLGDPARCRFVPVTLAETLSISETCALVHELGSLKVTISDIVVNRLVPPNSCPACADAQRRQQRELQNLFARLSGNTFWGLPLYPEEVRGPKRLEAFWKGAKKLDVITTALPSGPLAVPVRVEETAQPPWSGKSLLIFAGKGGVGKTTLACATATRLAAESPEGKVLLFSADPAHSLSTCLDLPVGATPTSICPGLWAMEINAQAEFETLKQEYREELNEFLGSLLPSLDLTFDREVMERILDLSPPGLDEIMALMRIMKFLERDQYDVIVLDTAPTGHLIRLLELPQLVDRWLKVFFGLFLKYKQVFRLPRIAQRLVELSKRIKQFRALLSDSSKSALYAVSILTLMALEETRDLLNACQRIGIFTPVLFLNQATPDCRCPLCSALYQGEQAIRREFREAFPDRQQTLIYKQGEPQGLVDLKRLGQALYAFPTAGKFHSRSTKVLHEENDTPSFSEGRPRRHFVRSSGPRAQ